MDQVQLTGQNLGRVFNSRSGRMKVVQLLFFEAKLPNLKKKTRPKQLLNIMLPAWQQLKVTLHYINFAIG
jgi:hypothetical protein